MSDFNGVVDMETTLNTYQSQKYTEELNHVCVGHRVETSHQGVEDGDHGGDDDRHVDVNVHDDTQGGPCATRDSTSLSTVSCYMLAHF